MGTEIHHPGETVPCRVRWIKHDTGVEYTPDQSSTITIFDTDGAAIAAVTDEAMTELSTGIVYYHWATLTTQAKGDYTFKAIGTDGTGGLETIQYAYGSFRLT